MYRETDGFIETNLPKDGVLKSGDRVSNYHLLPIEVLLEEGWIDEEYIPKKKEKTLEEAKKEKIQTLSNACHREIISGFYSEIKGEKLLYDFDVENQVNMSGIAYAMDKGQIIDGTFEYYSKGGDCVPYSNTEFIQLYSEGFAFKYERIQKYKAMKKMVELCETEEEVRGFTWENKFNIEDEIIL